MDAFIAVILQILGSDQFIGLVLAIVSTAATLIINRAAGAFTAATGLEIEKKHRDALHEAIKTSTESALRYGPEVGFGTLKAHVTAHLHESVPDALAALTPGDGVLDRLIERYSAEFLRKHLPREGAS